METNNQNSRDSSNNTQSTDEHIKTLEGTEALKKLKDLATSAENCFFCTSIKTGLPLSVRPMSVLQVDDEGNLWFMSMKDSAKNKEIESDPFTHLFFQENKNSGFLNVYGITEISTDQAKIDELWNPLLKVWFQGGKEDPNISLLKVVPTNVYYWDNVHGDMIAFAKMAVSIVTGKTMDDSVEGNLNF
ncbi:pyridoxamine 5'-phosphate oxidase family protein [Pedobacter sp. MC2016-14]|uniref:pyridoxamine 5'-phosphate oxidase family protein n=1 Tax=Pedobacter sp. MC2016-14 TaxID=2897327 RepID=UPI001E36703E|nr:pyridoxamine 5'-phosphate oxidase family protein [Pedobacter sp. MC2016-14]MCD0489044.1 pyridoxamine 5'-phosphate oxidase family protein [Pedobacter sp. MC2016-14]